MTANKWVSFNGSIKKKGEAQLPATQTGIYYGTGCFETFCSTNGKLFRFGRHVERLHKGLRYLGVQADLFPAENQLWEEISELLRISNLLEGNAKIRIQCVLAENGGYLPGQPAQLFRLIECSEYKGTQAVPVTLITANTRVVPSVCRPAHVKLSNMLHYREAAREAFNADADDALMLTTDGYVAESTIANVFWKKENTVFTPSVECDILPGIMRSAVLQVLEEMDYKLVEGKFLPAETEGCDLMWLTNSMKNVQLVDSLHGRKTLNVRELPFYEDLENRLNHLIANESR